MGLEDDEDLKAIYEPIRSEIEQELRKSNLTYEALFELASHAEALNRIFTEFILPPFIHNVKDQLNDQDIAVLKERQSWHDSLKVGIPQIISNTKSMQGRRAANARLEKDPVQIALKEIELEFNRVSNQFKRHGYGAEFCRKMQDKYPIILDPRPYPN